MILLHGTTRRRAEQILEHGPDPRYREPGGLGQFEAKYLMPLALAHAGRLGKYGA